MEPLIRSPQAEGTRYALSAAPGLETPPVPPRLSGWQPRHVDGPAEIRSLPPEERPLVGLMQVRPGNLAACREILASTELIEWIALTEPSTEPYPPDMVELLASGFFDFHRLPTDPERLTVTLGHAAGMAQLRRQAYLRRTGAGATEAAGILGDSPSIQRLRRDIAKVARCSATVLIQGESGSGKELAAQAIHDASQRREHPFVAVNCGAIPAELVQSELFGHERGAFTGAHQRRAGHLERANGGTILLDEVGELSLEHQVSLLRVLEERAVTRVGGGERIPLDIRVIAATHVDLAAAVEKGRFREDLYYRLNVLHVDVPPLRERGDDIERLAHIFLERFHRAYQTPPRGFTLQALGALRRHRWPGNIRELLNRIQRAVAMSSRTMLTPEDLGLEARDPDWREVETLSEARARGERAAVLRALARCDRNVSAAARQLGVSRVTLYRTMHRLGVRP